MRFFLKKLFSLIPENKGLQYWVCSWYFLTLIQIVPTLPSSFDNGFGNGLFFSFFMLTVGVYLLLGMPFLSFLYESVNSLSVADFEYTHITTLIAMIIFWTPIILSVICMIFLPIFTRKDIKFSLLISLILIYLIFLFFWRGKGLEDDDYFWLFLFPGFPLYAAIIGFALRFEND